MTTLRPTEGQPLPLDATRKALALAVTLTSVWAAWNDDDAHALDDALRIACEGVQSLDRANIPGNLISPLRYFALSYLEESNLEDLTYDEMLGSIAVALSQFRNWRRA